MKPRAELLRDVVRVERDADRLLSEEEVGRRVERSLFHVGLRSTTWITPCCAAAIIREGLHHVSPERWCCACECHRAEPEKTGLGRDPHEVERPWGEDVEWTQLLTPWDSRCGSLDLNWEEFPDLYADLVDETEAARIGLEYYYSMGQLKDG